MSLIVGIDAGHGGTDPGAMWPIFVPEAGASELQVAAAKEAHRTTAIVEATQTLCMARYLAQRLKHGVEPVVGELLRHREDESLSQRLRGERSSTLGCGLVISLHYNSGSPAQRGAECYHWPGNLMGAVIGDTILDAMPPPLRRPGRRSFAALDGPGSEDDWMRRPRHVLGAHSCPVVLVEIAYLTREEDRAAIADPATQACIVTALEAGIYRWRQLIESPHIAGL